MNIENELISIYNSAIKQTELLNIPLTKENVKRICTVNIHAICQAIENNSKIDEPAKVILTNHYKKIDSKISTL